MADIAKLYAVLDVVERADKVGLWDQGAWWSDREGDEASLDVGDQHFCGTAYCFAGWALALDGWKPDTNGWLGDMVKGGKKVFASVGARDLLSLGPADADMLFDERNSLADLRDLIDAFAAEARA